MNVNKFPCFKADRNGTDQTGMASATWTQILFTTERYDIGSLFATSAWTPPAGRISMVGSLLCAGAVTTNGVDAVGIYKDGALFAQSAICAYASTTAFVNIAADDIATGSNVYTLWGYVTGGTGRLFNGAAAQTFFAGIWYSA